jgi:hypothetical protein
MALSYRQFSVLYDRLLSLRWKQEWQLGAIAAAIYRSGTRDFDPMPKADNFIFTKRPGAPTQKVVKKRRMTKKLRQDVVSFFRSIPARRSGT